MSGRTYRYSPAFKLKVITEIESGQYTIAQARRIYDIHGNATIQNWLRNYGKTHLLNKVVHVQMRDEKDKVKQLKKQIKALEHALAKSQVDNLCWKSLVEVLDEKYGIDSKKNFGSQLPPELQDLLKNLQ